MNWDPKNLKAWKAKLPYWVANKYFATVLLFLAFIAFFDSYTVFDLFHWRSELHDLEEEKTYYQNEIAKLEADEANLTSDPENIERFAREKYYMKKPNEEIFLIVREDD